MTDDEELGDIEMTAGERWQGRLGMAALPAGIVFTLGGYVADHGPSIAAGLGILLVLYLISGLRRMVRIRQGREEPPEEPVFFTTWSRRLKGLAFAAVVGAVPGVGMGLLAGFFQPSFTFRYVPHWVGICSGVLAGLLAVHLALGMGQRAIYRALCPPPDARPRVKTDEVPGRVVLLECALIASMASAAASVQLTVATGHVAFAVVAGVFVILGGIAFAKCRRERGLA